MAATRVFFNGAVRRDGANRGLFTDDEYRDVHAYYADHPELSPTPLRRLRSLAGRLGIASVDAKDETHRFGVNAFKIVGVRYAAHRLGDEAAARGLVCATAGNHGRAVARVARQKRVPCTVFVPKEPVRDARHAPTDEPLRPGWTMSATTRRQRIDAMREDGAEVIEVDGTYEDAVRQAAAFGVRTGATIISDTAWEGYERIPRWIMAGYTQILAEASSQWDAPPSLVIVQGGVGGLVCAAASWFAYQFGDSRPYLIAAEPENAACLLASAQAGRPVVIDSNLDTIMAGLRCAEPSVAAWPAIASCVDAFVSVSDSAAVDAMRVMTGETEEGIDSGPSGACGVAALMQITLAPELAALRSAARLDRASRAFVIVTEGV